MDPLLFDLARFGHCGPIGNQGSSLQAVKSVPDEYRKIPTKQPILAIRREVINRCWMVSTILRQKLNSSVFHQMSIPRGDFFALEV
jgi:hypothetical protein